MMQLVTDRVSMLNPAKDDEWYDPERSKPSSAYGPNRWWTCWRSRATPSITSRRAGHRRQGARDLIERFGGVEAAIERAAEVERRTYRESLQNNAETIRMSRRLATIATDVPIEFTVESVKAQPPDTAALKSVYRELEFHSLLKELGATEDTRERDYRASRNPRSWPPGWLPLKARR